MRGSFLLALLPLLLFAEAHIFVFHRFGDPRFPSTSTSVETLKAEFDYLQAEQYEVIPLSRLARALKAGEPIDDRWVVLTIDDGYRSFYENALPLFKTYGYPFTLFVSVEATDKGYHDYMSWEQIRDTSKYGEIALHGYGHRHEVHLAQSVLREDTERALRSFQNELRRVPRYYAYPYGEYDTSVRAAIASYGFELILNQTAGAISGSSDPHDLDRIALTGENLLPQKLKIERLDVEWITPRQWPDRGRLNEIHAKISPQYKTAELYVTDAGWRCVAVRNGLIRETLDLPLKNRRTRLFLKVGNKQNGIILVKE